MGAGGAVLELQAFKVRGQQRLANAQLFALFRHQLLGMTVLDQPGGNQRRQG
ncbi:hypothetical protein D3C80_1636000 [compost metagenome]